MSDEWELLKQSDLYVSRKQMQSIPKKPDEPEEPEPVDAWQKLCPDSTVDEYGNDRWQEQPRNDLPVVECGDRIDPLGRKHKDV